MQKLLHAAVIGRRDVIDKTSAVLAYNVTSIIQSVTLQH